MLCCCHRFVNATNALRSFCLFLGNCARASAECPPAVSDAAAHCTNHILQTVVFACRTASATHAVTAAMRLLRDVVSLARVPRLYAHAEVRDALLTAARQHSPAVQVRVKPLFVPSFGQVDFNPCC